MASGAEEQLRELKLGLDERLRQLEAKQRVAERCELFEVVQVLLVVAAYAEEEYA